MRGLPRIDLPRLCRPLEPEADPGIKPLPWALGVRARAPAVSDRTDRPRGAATCQRSGSVGPGSLQIDPIGCLKGTESCTTVFSESTQGRAGRGPARPFSLCSPLQTVCQPPARVFLASRLPSPRVVGRPGKAAERRRGAGTRFGCSCGAPSIARIGREAKRGDEQRSTATNEAVDRRSDREGSGRRRRTGGAGRGSAGEKNGHGGIRRPGAGTRTPVPPWFRPYPGAWDPDVRQPRTARSGRCDPTIAGRQCPLDRSSTTLPSGSHGRLKPAGRNRFDPASFFRALFRAGRPLRCLPGRSPGGTRRWADTMRKDLCYKRRILRIGSAPVAPPIVAPPIAVSSIPAGDLPCR